jgi:hypothetical protein
MKYLLPFIIPVLLIEAYFIYNALYSINKTTTTILQQLEINQAIIENIVGDIVK